MKVRVLLTGGLERYTKPVASFARTLPLVNYFLIVINQASRQLVAECACAHLPRCPQVATCKCAADDKARVRMVERPMARARQHGAQCGGRKTRWALATVHSGLALGVQCTPSRGCGGMWDVGCWYRCWVSCGVLRFYRVSTSKIGMYCNATDMRKQHMRTSMVPRTSHPEAVPV